MFEPFDILNADAGPVEYLEPCGRAYSQKASYLGWIISADGRGDILTIMKKDSGDDASPLANLVQSNGALALQAFGQIKILAALIPDQVRAIASEICDPDSTTAIPGVDGSKNSTYFCVSDLTVADWVRNKICPNPILHRKLSPSRTSEPWRLDSAGPFFSNSMVKLPKIRSLVDESLRNVE
jgi:hypothetical protein